MIYINKNEINEIVLTLSELVSFSGNGNTSSSDSNFLFSFSYEGYMENIPVYWWSTATYSSERYDLFLLSDSDTTGATGSTGGTLNLLPGQHKYRIWSSTQSIDENNYLMIATSSSIIEEGLAVINGINTQIDDIYN